MRLLYALRFLTILPISYCKNESLEDVARSTIYYPFVGLLIGGFLYGAALALAYLFPVFPWAVLMLSLWVIVTGGLHLDGVSDLADGLGGGQNREEKLAIMKDSRVGAFGAISLIIILLIKLSMISELSVDHSRRAFLLAPIGGRSILLILIHFFPSARPGGLGDFFRPYSTLKGIITGLVFSFGFGWLLFGVTGIIMLSAAFLAVVLLGVFISRVLGGLTGDVYGAAIEICEVLILTAAVFLQGLV